MILEKIKGVLGLAPKKPIVEMLISVEKIEKRVALLENGRLEEFHIERRRDMTLPGSIFKGRVKNIEPGLKAMFVDIGAEKNAFLHYWDAMPAALDEVETVDRGRKKSARKRIQVSDIPKLYPEGSDVIVQVTKGPIGTKGARLTTNISIPGRFLVLTPFSDQFGISRKIEAPQERARLRKILSQLEVPDGIGVIIRTVGEGQKARFFVRDLAILLEKWREIEIGLEKKSAPVVLLQESDVVERAVRDFLTDDVDRIIVDQEEAYERVRKTVEQISRRSLKKVKLYQEMVPLFEKFGIERQLENSFQRKVMLKSGASIVVDETEALVAIDVNTGRTKVDGAKENTILATNLEAADEIARQIRLRNMGGLLILDFIDMKSRRDQQAVYQRLRQALSRDKAKTHVLPISPLGLIEMTRQRTEESVAQSHYQDCPQCGGRGVIKTAETMSVEVQRGISRIMRQHPDVHELRVFVNPVLLDRLRKEDEEALVELERRYGGRLAFRADPKLHAEEFVVVNALTEEELK
ncbi:MAG: Rne/Rng family ribonuclease [Verrucomicrobiae bacterium]|nr:Rne/Rng family ribonuclease [Verrucomicrobiae bacterium]